MFLISGIVPTFLFCALLKPILGDVYCGIFILWAILLSIGMWIGCIILLTINPSVGIICLLANLLLGFIGDKILES